MPQRITPSKIVTVSKEGEVHVSITIDLNINLNHSGETTIAQSVTKVEEKNEDEDKVNWEIPDFSPVSDFQFGKEVK